MPYKTSLISRFESSISQVNELLAIHHLLKPAPVTQVTDNILRASLTMMVSAIDTSIHELIISAIMFEIKEDKSVFKLDNVKVSALASKESDQNIRIRLIESDLRRQFSRESYQSSRQIENSLAQIGITKIWTKLAFKLGQPAEDIKLKLDLLVRRRNQIVHEGDLDHLHSIRDIDREDLDESLKFTKDLVVGIIDEYTKLITV
jgi:RiboL-PSP-HEPN